ncbi:MAG: hypothetical protein AAGE96_04070 [Cyanobacteria bacterium P01_G01_bin.19]
MSNLFKYKTALDADIEPEEQDTPSGISNIPYLAFILACTIFTTAFAAIVVVLSYCFPGSLDGTYLKLFF